MSAPLDRLRYHVTGAIERGEAVAIEGRPVMSAPRIIPDTVRATVGEHAATVGETVARRYFAGNALTRAARLTERDLAMIAATAAHVALTTQPKPDYRVLWEAWGAGTLDPSASSDATLAAALAWNDPNGDYSAMLFPDLLECVAYQLELSK